MHFWNQHRLVYNMSIYEKVEIWLILAGGQKVPSNGVTLIVRGNFDNMLK